MTPWPLALRAAVDAVLTMLPPWPSATIAFAAAWLPTKADFRFMRRIASNPPSEISSAGSWKFPPALLNIASIRPNSLRAPATSARIDSA